MIGSRWAVGTFLIAIALAYMSSAAAAQHTTVVGIAYGTYELVTDSGEVYELVADEKGSELAGLDGLRVRANGMLEVSGGRMILQVLSYSVLEEEPRYQDGMMEEELPGRASDGGRLPARGRAVSRRRIHVGAGVSGRGEP
ncbi:MAG TPA: hypothetical protein PKW48_01625 [Deltaproteobacteria bacterium]|nr:hypothetical protein [Deltaproteobacteria bacterium]